MYIYIYTYTLIGYTEECPSNNGFFPCAFCRKLGSGLDVGMLIEIPKVLRLDCTILVESCTIGYGEISWVRIRIMYVSSMATPFF